MIQSYSYGDIYLLYENRQHGCKFNFGNSLDTRKIIAAVARCAWLDTARGICETEFNERPPLETNWKKLSETIQYRGALDNAEAWRVWGNE